MMVGGTPGVKVKLVNDALKRNEIAVERLGVIFPVDHLPLRPVLVSEKRTWGVSHLVRKSWQVDHIRENSIMHQAATSIA